MEKKTIPGQYVPNGTFCSLWFCQACSASLDAYSWKAADGEEGRWCIKCLQRHVKSPVHPIQVENQKWIRGWTEVKCCDHWLVCDGFTNTCDSCGQDFNGSGQALAPREQWGEETGESLSEILNIS